MKPPQSHAEAHAAWSAEQFAEFKRLSSKDRLAAVKNGALEDWRKGHRDAAFNLIAGVKKTPSSSARPAAPPFEAATTPLPRLATHSPSVDPFLIVTVGGWILIVALVAAYAYDIIERILL